MKDDRLYLSNIDEALGRIAAYTGEGRDAFERSTLIQDAVIRNFEIVGEAAKKVSAGTRERSPQVPWRTVAGFRDVLIHNYNRIDLGEVWAVVERDLPALRAEIRTLLESAG